MQELPRDGGMAAVLADADDGRARPIAPPRRDLAIAALNGPRSVVISGRTDALEAAVGELDGGGRAGRAAAACPTPSTPR